MRRLTGLRRRRTADPASTDTTVPSASSDPIADPPIVAALVQPLLSLRATLGTGVAVPDATMSSALVAESTRAADTEGSHRDGIHALESTWISRGSDAAVPALRTTQTEIGDISDRGPAYLAVLTDAQATSARAARRVDQIIADFRRDARQILGNATAAPDTDAVIDRAAQALRDAITTVDSARSQMSDHTRRLDEMGPLTVTAPAGVTAGQPSTSTPGTPGTAVLGVPGQPLDPAQAAQLQLQQQLIAAGVQLGTAAISAGVDIGTHLIDKIVEVGTHAMDTVAASADKAIPELIHPGSTTGGDSPGSSQKLFDFGGGSRQPGQSSSATGLGTVIPPGHHGSGPAAKPDLSNPDGKPAPPASVNGPAKPDSAPGAQPPKPAAPGGAGQPGTTGGMAMPPPAADGQDRRPREGQLGVTVPAIGLDAAEATVPVAVIGDFGDDTP